MPDSEPIFLAEVETTVVYEFIDNDDNRRRGGGPVWYGPSWSSGTDSGVVTSGGFVPSGGPPDSGPPAVDTSPVDTSSTETTPTDTTPAEGPAPDSTTPEGPPPDTAPAETAPARTTPTAPAAPAAPAPAGPAPTVHGFPVKVPSSPIIKLWAAPAQTPAEQAMEQRLRVGDGTPQEALRWFQEHGYPSLTSLPAWSPDRRLWLFPDLAGSTAGSAGHPARPGGAPPGTGGSAPAGPPPPGPAQGSVAAMFAGYGAGNRPPGASDAGHGGHAGGRAGGRPGGTRDGSAPGGQAGGLPGAPAVPGSVPGSTGAPGHPAAAEDFDDNPFVVPPSHFASDQIDGTIRDIMDTQVPMVARIVLANALPPAYLALVLEKFILNPLLAMPANLYEAGRQEYLAMRALAAGDIGSAIEHDRAAAHHMREAALAILAVVPFGEGASAGATAGERLAASGIEYLGSRPFYPGNPSLVHQAWVTGSLVEHKFLLPSGKILYADGFINRTGVDVAGRMADMVLVEVKMDTRVAQVLEGTSSFAFDQAQAMFNQFERYVEVGQRLGVGGLRYVITEAGPGTPITNAFRATLRKLRPDLFESGFLEVFSTPPPPPGFTGL